MDYCNCLFYEAPSFLLYRLQKAPFLIDDSYAARIITHVWKRNHISPTLAELHRLPVKQRIDYKILLYIYKALNDLAPDIRSSKSLEIFKTNLKTHISAGLLSMNYDVSSWASLVLISRYFSFVFCFCLCALYVLLSALSSLDWISLRYTQFIIPISKPVGMIFIDVCGMFLYTCQGFALLTLKGLWQNAYSINQSWPSIQLKRFVRNI